MMVKTNWRKSRIIFLRENEHLVYFIFISLLPGFIVLRFLELIRFYCQKSALRFVFRPKVVSLCLLIAKCPK